jgi:hypothetical protein
LSEHEVRGQHAQRADREARHRAERVADDERHRSDRLDVRQRDEGVAAERCDCRQRAHDGHHARRRARALVGQPTERERDADHEE